MKDPYINELNTVFNGIYDSILRLESQLLLESGQNLSISELHILESIWLRSADGCSISDLAQEHLVTLPSMTNAIKKLEKKDFVTKARSETDGRVVYVALSETGEKINSMHQYFHERMIRAFIRGVDEKEKPILLSALKNMSTFIKHQLEISESKTVKL